ncbi:MAG: 4-(cytidine 5'-diphospho)-2-C-methyl-D-erythritol kinase [bacterium]|nr:4-(cytidine 5'-diphospho)-2-C-methyl-D-erythritol kinase [bacterium]
MTKKIKIAAPAKINLSLEIIDKFPNGFHRLSTVMQTVSLFDYLTIDLSKTDKENQIILSGNSDKIPYDEKNIVYKALQAYLDELGKKGCKIEVFIEKNIPSEAGLAGGSADGAAALKGINKLFNNKLSEEKIHQIAANIGSDLNFCLAGGACLLSSRGEVIEEKLPHKEFSVVIIKPKNISVSTPQCYKKFSEKYFEKKEAFYSKKIANLFKKDFSVSKLCEYLYNDLEKPAIDMFPEIQEIKNILINAGCKGVLMSGSGSSVFGIYENEVTLPQNPNWEVFRVKTTN